MRDRLGSALASTTHVYARFGSENVALPHWHPLGSFVPRCIVPRTAGIPEPEPPRAGLGPLRASVAPRLAAADPGRSVALPKPSATVLAMESTQRASKLAREAEVVRLNRLREDAQRPMSVNLAEGIALSHKLMRFVGSARLH